MSTSSSCDKMAGTVGGSADKANRRDRRLVLPSEPWNFNDHVSALLLARLHETIIYVCSLCHPDDTTVTNDRTGFSSNHLVKYCKSVETRCKSTCRNKVIVEMAIDFLTVPPTSCDVERAFSAGRRTINDFQHATSHDLLDAKVCIGNWAAPGSPFLGSVQATIKKATTVMEAEMRRKGKNVPTKRTNSSDLIEVLTTSGEE